MRNLLAILALVLLLPTMPAQAAEPDSLKTLEERLIAATKKLEQLVVEASRDPRERQLETYLKFSRKEMANKKRELRAETILGWMAAPGNFEFRQACKDALKKGAQLLDDPDLSSNIKKRPGTNRGYFFKNLVVPLLKNKDDRDARVLGAALLKDLYGRVPSIPEIFNYNVDNTSTWGSAAKEWGKYLRKK